MKWLKTLLWMVLFLVAVLFAVQNREEVIIRFAFLPLPNYLWFQLPETPLPLFVILLGSLLLGVLIGGLSDVLRRVQLRRDLREHGKTIQRLEQEIESLRGPTSDPLASPRKEP